jgi:2-succinyl-5-enolpyruvyl-6-hydroxy-3-cyclohexene-1-carboxylate synthase
VAFAQHSQIEAIPVLDERSASFFALGLAKRSRKPVVLVCTSGTAGANFYPAVIEARESRVPLLVLTADRPPELRDCNAGQSIDQQKLFGAFPNYYAELAIPAVYLLEYLRQKTFQAFQQTIYPVAGVVHLNVPLCEPLAPLAQADIQALEHTFPTDFFEHCRFHNSDIDQSLTIPSAWPGKKGIIIAGIASPQDSEIYCRSIAQLSATLGYPVLSEGLSPVRNYASWQPCLITTYDAILRQDARASALVPEIVIRVGEMPTSKILRTWLAKTQPQIWIVDTTPRSIDPIHGKTRQLFGSIESLKYAGYDERVSADFSKPYCQIWQTAEAEMRTLIDQTFALITPILESKVAWLLPQVLPAETPIFIANSMPVRDVEYFWPGNDRGIQPFFNRGANGIDGTLSSALGIAHRGKPTILLTGDLALLHDTNGFLLRQYWHGSLTIVLINNNGGGIFGMLPIAQFEPPFEHFFATPQDVDFADLCKTYGVGHTLIENWQDFQQLLDPLPTRGIRVLEVRCDRAFDARWRQQLQASMA